VQTDADPETRRLTYVSCTCPHGLNTGGSASCSHAVAVLITIRNAEKETTDADA
jgi:uncharacterized Zn finger protein